MFVEKDGIADELRRQLRLEKIKRKRIQNDLKQSSKKLKRVTKELKKVNHLDHERLKARDRFWDFLDELFEAGEISEGERDRRWKESVEFGRVRAVFYSEYTYFCFYTLYFIHIYSGTRQTTHACERG